MFPSGVVHKRRQLKNCEKLTPLPTKCLDWLNSLVCVDTP